MHTVSADVIELNSLCTETNSLHPAVSERENSLVSTAQPDKKGGMGGNDEQQLDVFSYVSPEQRVPQDHPLRPIRIMADEALGELKRRFGKLYAKTGQKLLRALLLQVLYSVRSERILMEQPDYNVLFRWFVGLNMDDPIWDATVFTKNRQRLVEGDIADAFFAAVLKQARERDLLSDEHFTVDGTLLEAWAGQKSFRRVEDDLSCTLHSGSPFQPRMSPQQSLLL
jgi:transposase